MHKPFTLSCTASVVVLGLLAPGAATAGRYVAEVNGNYGRALRQIEAAGGTITAEIEAIDLVVLESDEDDFLDTLEGLSVVSSAAHDWSATMEGADVYGAEASSASAVDPSDDGFVSLQWNLDAVSASDAWDAGYTGAGVRVCMLDQGIDTDHLDLAANLNLELSTSFVPGESVEAVDWTNHGTSVAGVQTS